MKKYIMLMSYDAGCTGTEENVKVTVHTDKSFEDMVDALVMVAYHNAVEHVGSYRTSADDMYDEVYEETGCIDAAQEAYVQEVENTINYHAELYVEKDHDGITTYGCGEQNTLEVTL